MNKNYLQKRKYAFNEIELQQILTMYVCTNYQVVYKKKKNAY